MTRADDLRPKGPSGSRHQNLDLGSLSLDSPFDCQYTFLDQVSFGSPLARRDDAPDFFEHSKYGPDSNKVELVERRSDEAKKIFSERASSLPLRIPRNPDGETNYEYIITKLSEAGITPEAPLMKRVFDAARVPLMLGTGTDRQNGMTLTSHHGGDDGEWLAMKEHGLGIFDTGRTTYVSGFSERDTRDLTQAGAVAIYDSRGLMSCQPSINRTNSFSNGHHLFLVPPRDALLAVFA